jgi:hypothetical protein
VGADSDRLGQNNSPRTAEPKLSASAPYHKRDSRDATVLRVDVRCGGNLEEMAGKLDLRGTKKLVGMEPFVAYNGPKVDGQLLFDIGIRQPPIALFAPLAAPRIAKVKSTLRAADVAIVVTDSNHGLAALNVVERGPVRYIAIA